MKNALIATGAVAVLAAGGCFTLQGIATARAEQAFDALSALLPAGYAMTYGKVEGDLFSTGAVIDDLRITTPDADTITIGRMAIEGADIAENGRLRFDRVNAADFAMSGAGDPSVLISAFEIDDAILPMPGTPGFDADAIGLALTAKTMWFSNLSVDDGEAALTIGEVTLTGVADGIVQDLGANGFRLLLKEAGHPGTVSFGTLSHGPIQIVGNDADDWTGPVAFGDHLRITGAEIDIEDAARITIDEVSVDGVERSGDVVDRFDASVRGFALDVADIDDEDVRAGLNELGYQRIAFDADLRPRFDGAARTLDVDPFSISIHDAGAVRAVLSLVDVPIGPEQLAEDGIEPVMAASLRRFEIGYTDRSLIRRMIDVGAGHMGVTRGEFVQILQDDIDRVIGSAGTPLSGQLAAALRDFVQDPGELVLTAVPTGQVQVGEVVMGTMMSPAMLAEKAGVSIVHR